jgi:glycosyltransferase involved in cell wall biosynthesis
MQFSVVIPTYQRRDLIVRMVVALERQSYRDFEVIVVVDGSTDRTAAALRDLDLAFPLTLLEQSNQGAAAARNAGAGASSGELLVFLDDDMEAHRQMLAEHAHSHREGADLVLGHLALHRDSPSTLLSQEVASWSERRRALLSRPEVEVPLAHLLTGQMSISRIAFQQIGGFDVSFTRNGLFGGEDLDFGYRVRKAGLRVIFNPAAVSYQLYDVDPALYTRRSREAGRAAEELLSKHPDLVGELEHWQFDTRLDRIVFGALAVAPRIASSPLRALAVRLVRRGLLGPRTRRLFFGVQTMEYLRGVRETSGRRSCAAP